MSQFSEEIRLNIKSWIIFYDINKTFNTMYNPCNTNNFSHIDNRKKL